MNVQLSRACCITLLAGVAGLVVLSDSAPAQTGRTVFDGVYSQSQAALGKQQYDLACKACHGGSLQGIDVAPQLAGNIFRGNWNGTSAADLANRIRRTMPLNAPGSLGSKASTDIVAYLFKMNGYPAGSVAMPANAQLQASIKIIDQAKMRSTIRSR